MMKPIAIYLSLLILFIPSCKTADLSNQQIRDNCQNTKAIQLLDEMAAAHQLERWKAIETYQVHIRDQFYGLLGKLGNPYPGNFADLELTYLPGTFTGKGEFKSGKWKNNTWGLQSWHTYQKQGDGPIRFDKKNHKDILFWIPTYQYFLELPLRIREGNVFCYAGQQMHDGQAYDLVFASWKTVVPQKDLDQYLLWINQKTKRLDIAEYTVRDANKWIRGAIFFEDYQEMEGLLLPRSMPVRAFSVDAKKLMHEIKVLEVRVNTVDREVLIPKPKLGEPAGKNE